MGRGPLTYKLWSGIYLEDDMRILAGTIIAALALSACGSGDETTYKDAEGNEVTIKQDGDGESVKYNVESKDGNASFRVGSELVDDLPFGFKPYPGAQIVTSTIGTSQGRAGGMVLMKSDDSREKAIEYYRGLAKKAGIEVQTEITSGDALMIAGENDKQQGFSVQAIKIDDGTQITLFVGGEN